MNIARLLQSCVTIFALLWFPCVGVRTCAGSVNGMDLSELIAAVQNDTSPVEGAGIAPTVVLQSPVGGETFQAGVATSITWTGNDDGTIQAVNLYHSDDNGALWRPIALDLHDSGQFSWFPGVRPTIFGLIRVQVVDDEGLTSEAISPATFTITVPGNGIVSSTARDFDLPGTQPLEVVALNDPAVCQDCHADYGQQEVEPYFTWKGSMMAQASRDPLFWACLTIANQDAPGSGDLCLRCHVSQGWLGGRSTPEDGTAIVQSDMIGVSCDLCHRMVDPILDVGNPAEDAAILDALTQIPSDFGSGAYVIDPDNARRRGPFDDLAPNHAQFAHPWVASSFFLDSAMCGTCHDVSNPAFERDDNGNYVPNNFDQPPSDTSPQTLMPIERTYSEWLNSSYNSAEGVYAPQFAGNKPDGIIRSCMDCHLRDVSGKACRQGFAKTRDDLPLHDLTGGNVWMLGILAELYPEDADALLAGAQRARNMLQNAAELDVRQEGARISVTVTNNTGHKLPTGYPEGRRMWINVRVFDDANSVVYESGAYDPNSALLTHDEDLKVYEAEIGTDGIPGVPDATLFHFVLGNKILKDNRIPPRGFTNAAYADFGGAPVGATYADGQYHDSTVYTLPPGAARVEVRLYYQTASREYITFLRDENVTDSRGDELYSLWENSGKCPPELMARVSHTPLYASGDLNHDFAVNVADLVDYAAWWLDATCQAQNGDCQGADWNGDGIVNYRDFIAIVLSWLLP